MASKNKTSGGGRWEQLTHFRSPDASIEVGAICGWRRVSYYDYLDALQVHLRERAPERRLSIRFDEKTGRVALWEFERARVAASA